jgi:mycofactocin system creatininase family protein
MSPSPALLLERATSPQVDEHPRRALLIPVGALEQHGPHLPLGTDTQIATAVASAGARRCAGTAVAPAISVGASDEHRDFAGTLSIGTDALAALLVALARDASRSWATVLFVNAHGGNAAAMTEAVRQLRDEGLPCAAHHVSVTGGDAHAGHTETSIMLRLDPHAVRLDLARAGNRRPIGDLMPLMRRGGVRSVSANGVLGDPSGADAQAGERMLDELAGACAEAVQTLISQAEGTTNGS